MKTTSSTKATFLTTPALYVPVYVTFLADGSCILNNIHGVQFLCAAHTCRLFPHVKTEGLYHILVTRCPWSAESRHIMVRTHKDYLIHSVWLFVTYLFEKNSVETFAPPRVAQLLRKALQWQANKVYRGRKSLYVTLVRTYQ